MTPKRQPRLTPERHQRIVAAVRAGGFPHLAAQAFGIPPELLEDWIKRGNEPGAREPYRSFAEDIDEAHAQARLKAEVDVLKENPRFWLERGPGRDRTGSPGWSAAVKPVTTSGDAKNALHDPEFVELLRLLIELLTPFPEARRAVAEKLQERGLPIAA